VARQNRVRFTLPGHWNQLAHPGRAIGSDTFGDTLLRQLQQDGIDATRVQRDPHSPTGCALVLVESGGQNVIVVAPGANSRLGDEDLQRALQAAGPDDLLLLQQEIPVAVVGEAIALSRARVLLNAAPPAPLDPTLLRRIAVLVANENEAIALFGGGAMDRSAEKAARRAHEAGVALAVVTLGKAGAVLCDVAGTARIPAFDVTSVDATAAGDTTCCMCEAWVRVI
jgi:ribokinase